MPTSEVFTRVVTAFATMGENPDARAMANPASQALPETPNAQTQTLDCPPPWDNWLNPQTDGATACYWRAEGIGVIRDLGPDQVVVVGNQFCDPDCLDKVEKDNQPATPRRNSIGLILRPKNGVVIIKFPKEAEGDDAQIRVVGEDEAKDLTDKVIERTLATLIGGTLFTIPVWRLFLVEIQHKRREDVWRRASRGKPAASAPPPPPEKPVGAAEPVTTSTAVTPFVSHVPPEVTWDLVNQVLDFLREKYGPELVITSQEQLRQAIETAQAQGRTEVIETLNTIAQGLDFQDIWQLLRAVANLRQRALSASTSTARTVVIDVK